MQGVFAVWRVFCHFGEKCRGGLGELHKIEEKSGMGATRRAEGWREVVRRGGVLPRPPVIGNMIVNRAFSVIGREGQSPSPTNF